MIEQYNVEGRKRKQKFNYKKLQKKTSKPGLIC
jgi:hypothetical protein